MGPAGGDSRHAYVSDAEADHLPDAEPGCRVVGDAAEIEATAAALAEKTNAACAPGTG